jgi:hypothetical protein
MVYSVEKLLDLILGPGCTLHRGTRVRVTGTETLHAPITIYCNRHLRCLLAYLGNIDPCLPHFCSLRGTEGISTAILLITNAATHTQTKFS